MIREQPKKLFNKEKRESFSCNKGKLLGLLTKQKLTSKNHTCQIDWSDQTTDINFEILSCRRCNIF